MLEVGPEVDQHASSFGSQATNGLEYGLTQCERRAPGVWVVRGRVELPDADSRVEGVMSISMWHGDTGDWGWGRHRVVFAGNGDFALAIENPHSPDRYGFDSVDSCSIDVSSDQVPVAESAIGFEHYLDPTAQLSPFVYEAPEDSVQALGIGAPLNDQSDPRTVSLNAIWSGKVAELEQVWVPDLPGELPALVELHQTPDSPCAEAWVQVGALGDGRVTVTTAYACDAPGELPRLVTSGQPVEGADGFEWVSEPSECELDSCFVARRREGLAEVRVSGASDAGQERVALVAAALVARRNLARPSVAPTRAATLDEAVARISAKFDGTVERARFGSGDRWFVVFDGPLADDDAPAPWVISVVRAGRVATGWWIEKAGGGGGSSTRCFVGPISMGGPDDVLGERAVTFAATGDPRWTIEGKVGGVWRDVPTTAGVAFQDRTDPESLSIPAELRPLNEHREVPGCSVRLTQPTR